MIFCTVHIYFYRQNVAKLCQMLRQSPLQFSSERKQNKNYISNNERFMPMQSLVALWGQGNLAHESRNVGHPGFQAFKS